MFTLTSLLLPLLPFVSRVVAYRVNTRRAGCGDSQSSVIPRSLRFVCLL